MIFESRHRRFLAEINIIPLVDVVLVLLIIFMVTAPMLYRGMDITLPTSSSNTIKPEERLVLTIERDQKVYLDKDLVPVGLLESKLKAAKQRNADVSVYLRADRDVAYGTVVQVMDGARGISKYDGRHVSPDCSHVVRTLFIRTIYESDDRILIGASCSRAPVHLRIALAGENGAAAGGV
jgi:biopolymer transport protein TolR